MTKVLLGVDAGTSAIKVCAFDATGKLLGKAQRSVPVITPHPLWVEVDLERYWELTAEAIREVIGRVGQVHGIGLSTTCPTTILLDREQQPLRPGIVYLDGRANDIVREVVGADAVAYQGQTGNRASTSTCWVANLRWVQRNEPEVWSRTRTVCMLNGFLAQRLSGKTGIDPTQASYSGLMDVRERAPAWSPSLLALWGIDPGVFAPLQNGTEKIGMVTDTAAGLTGLAPGTPLSLGAADTATAALAMGLRQSAQVFESVGTSGVITFCLDQPDFDPCFLNRYHIFPDRWLAHGAMSMLGGSFGWLQAKVWPEVQSFAELERMAQESEPGANGLIFLPYLAGERSPIWDAEASAAWIGLRLEHGRADMVRAVFEGAAFGLRQILAKAQAQWNWQPERLVGVGGGAHSRFWAQIKADVLQLEYGLAEQTDASALGAALMGGVAGGVYTGFDDPALPAIRLAPNSIKSGSASRRDVYDRQFSIFASLYPAMESAMHQLAARRAACRSSSISTEKLR
ncbi:MAG: FGGY-family carbohydrate kinase [Burkholderiaceae bacterium]